MYLYVYFWKGVLPEGALISNNEAIRNAYKEIYLWTNNVLISAPLFSIKKTNEVIQLSFVRVISDCTRPNWCRRAEKTRALKWNINLKLTHIILVDFYLLAAFNTLFFSTKEHHPKQLIWLDYRWSNFK